jgi:hypothetical protein
VPFPQEPPYEHVTFDCISAELVLSHVAAMLVMQGMKLSDLFPPDMRFMCGEHVLGLGPYVFLKGDLSTVQDPPLRLKNLVLAMNIKAPDGMKRDELLSVLLRGVL